MAEATETAGTEVVTREDLPDMIEEGGRFDLAEVEDPTRAMAVAERLVGAMAEKCEGPQYVATIQGRKYPKVEWWTTVGASLGLFPREEDCRKLDRADEIAYEATVGVYNGDQPVTRASAICSDRERTWGGRDEYAIRSMAITRATGKAYRLGLSFLAVMSGLEATPAEEMPSDGGTAPSATDKQINFLKGLLGERDLPEKDERALRARIERGMTRDEASKAIEYVKDHPEAGEGEEPSEAESGAEPSSAPPSTETPAGQWLALYESHRGTDTAERFRWERQALEDAFGDDAPMKDGRPDHAAMGEKHYVALADALREELDAEAQTEMV